MLELQTFTMQDCERFVGWVPNARFLLQFAGSHLAWPLTREQVQECCEEANQPHPKRYMFKAVEIETGAVVGHIEVMRIDYEEKSGRIGRVLIGDPAARGKGYGRQMVSQAIEFAFQTIGLEELRLGVFDFNTPAIRLYRSLGFEQYRVVQRDQEFEGEIWTAILMRLFRKNWKLAARAQKSNCRDSSNRPRV